MDDRLNASASPNEPIDAPNKYAEVLNEAAAIKRTRQNLDDERWNRPRPSPPQVGYPGE